jgi:hypothetical protein
MFALRLEIPVLFVLTDRQTLNLILGMSRVIKSVPLEVNMALRLTRKSTNMLRLMVALKTLRLKATDALHINLILTLRPWVLVIPRSPPVLVEMVEALCQAKRTGDTSVLGCR